MTLKLVHTLKESIAELEKLDMAAAGEPVSAEVVNLAVERVIRGDTIATEVTAETVLEAALIECREMGDEVTGCYITLICSDENGPRATCHYRAGLSRIEEIAFRQLGLTEVMDAWRGRLEE